MRSLVKYLFFILVLLFVSVVAYAYIGPYLGVDFSAPQEDIRVPIVIDVR